MRRATPIIAVVGMVREAKLLAGARAVVGGGDPDQLEARLQAALQEDVAPVVSFGLCGALDTALKPGDLVIGQSVIAAEERLETDIAWTSGLVQALPAARVGAIVHAAQPLATAAEKLDLGGSSGAIAVDMESLIAARLARRFQAPFVVLRAVSDGADRTLPAAARVGLGRDGRPAIGPVLAQLALRPWQTPALIRTAMEAETAFRALADARDLLGPGLGRPDLL